MSNFELGVLFLLTVQAISLVNIWSVADKAGRLLRQKQLEGSV